MAMTRSTFAGFTTAQLALAASQRALDVTGQNISNVNTTGYTRQRLDLASISPTGASYFQAQTDCRVGQGVEMTGVIQIRDPFLDIQYRDHLAKVGTIDAQDSALASIGDIFDEVDKTAVRAALLDVISQLNIMSRPADSNQGSSDTLVRSSMEVLLNVLHENASKLQDVQDDLVKKMQTTSIPDVNEYLESISVLNASIKNTQILGGAALELQDQRNQLIDELATYLPIDATYHELNLGAGIVVSTLEISFTDTNGNKYVLVDDDEYGSLGFTPEQPDLTVPAGIYIKEVGYAGADPGAEVTDVLGNGVLKGNLDALNKSGPCDDPPTDFKGIGYYWKLFDSFVSTFATKLNELNESAGGGPLFETIDGTGNFTANNIKVADAWLNGDTKIMTVDGMVDESTGNINALKMANLISSDVLTFEYNGKTLFEGSCLDAYDNIQATQAIERKATDSILETRTSVLNDIANSRDSVSGVWIDEEVINLMRYQQSYNAAARMMTTLDEALNTLINNTGVVGR